MTRRQFVLAGSAAAALAFGIGATARPLKRLRGLVIEVGDTSIKVRARDGKIVTFRLGQKVGMTLAHLREHMREEEPVTVIYQEEGTELVAMRITD